MKQLFTAILITLFISCTSREKKGPYAITSPDGENKITFELHNGIPKYSVTHGEKGVLDSSSLGFVLKNNDSLSGNFEVLDSRETAFDETWEQVWGEKRTIRNRYNELSVTLQEKSDDRRKMEIQINIK